MNRRGYGPRSPFPRKRGIVTIRGFDTPIQTKKDVNLLDDGSIVDAPEAFHQSLSDTGNSSFIDSEVRNLNDFNLNVDIRSSSDTIQRSSSITGCNKNRISESNQLYCVDEDCCNCYDSNVRRARTTLNSVSINPVSVNELFQSRTDISSLKRENKGATEIPKDFDRAERNRHESKETESSFNFYNSELDDLINNEKLSDEREFENNIILSAGTTLDTGSHTSNRSYTQDFSSIMTPMAQELNCRSSLTLESDDDDESSHDSYYSNEYRNIFSWLPDGISIISRSK